MQIKDVSKTWNNYQHVYNYQKNFKGGWVHLLMIIIPDTQEADIRRIMFEASLGKRLVRPHLYQSLSIS
jgi:hypothetical protein